MTEVEKIAIHERAAWFALAMAAQLILIIAILAAETPMAFRALAVAIAIASLAPVGGAKEGPSALAPRGTLVCRVRRRSSSGGG